jgi:SAM-dependent methyltransferase
MMKQSDSDRAFAGSIPRFYDTYLVPLIFGPYAADLAKRAAARQPARVLEIAAGTGVLTRQLATALSPAASIIATDLNQPMIDYAAAQGTARPLEWRQADAMQLPFADSSFDVVVCQFGAMFFPDKTKAFSEARRVLRDGGVFAFNVWDRIEENEFAAVVTETVASLFPDDPPLFLARTPYGYHDRGAMAQDLRGGGFSQIPEFTKLAARSRADSPRIPALAYCQGTPLRGEIEARDPARLDEATDSVTAAMAKRFGAGPVDGKIQAHVVTVER